MDEYDPFLKAIGYRSDYITRRYQIQASSAPCGLS